MNLTYPQDPLSALDADEGASMQGRAGTNVEHVVHTGATPDLMGEA